MGYDYSYGRSPYALASSFATLGIFMVLVFFVALGLSFFLYHRFVALPEGKKLKPDASAGFLERFLGFKQLIVADVMRWFYIFSALLVGLEGVVVSIGLIFMVGIDASFLIMAFVNMGVVLIAELILRVWYELMMLTVLIAKDTSSMHDMMARHYGYTTDQGSLDPSVQDSAAFAQNPIAYQQPAAQAPVAQAPVVQEPVAQAPVAQAPVVQEPVAQQPVSSYWNCPTCGAADNHGAFCKHCGTPRP